MTPVDLRESLKPYVCCCVRPGNKDMQRIDDDRFVTSPEWVGSSILFWGKKNSRFPYQCFVGPDWPVVILTYFLIISANIIILSATSPLGWIPVSIGICTCSIVLYFYTFTIATNPGYVYKEMSSIDLSPVVSVDSNAREKDLESGVDNHSRLPLLHTSEAPTSGSEAFGCESEVSECVQSANETENKRNDEGVGDHCEAKLDGTNGIKVYNNNGGNNSPQFIGAPPPTAVVTTTSVPSGVECGQCQMQRPYAARHCYYCDACVEELDHHCPWCGKCIGENNIDGFHCFVGWLNFQFYYLLGLTLYFLIVTHGL